MTRTGDARGRARAAAAAVLAAVLLAGCGRAGADREIHFGTQTYAEVKILGYAGKMLIEEYTDCTARVTTDLGGIALIDEAMQRGDVDAMIAFTGGAGGLLHPRWRDRVDLSDPRWRDPEEVYRFARDMMKQHFNRILLEPLGYENTYALTMRADRARQLGIRTISDLRGKSRDMVIGMDDAYKERPVDGYFKLLEHYGLEPFRETVSMNINLLYHAIRDGQVDVGVAYSSDARIHAFDLVWLEDDRRFYPPYHALYAIRGEAAEACPGAVEALGRLSGRIPIETMRRLNYAVDIEKRHPEEVAREFLQELGLIR